MTGSESTPIKLVLMSNGVIVITTPNRHTDLSPDDAQWLHTALGNLIAANGSERQEIHPAELDYLEYLEYRDLVMNSPELDPDERQSEPLTHT